MKLIYFLKRFRIWLIAAALLVFAGFSIPWIKEYYAGPETEMSVDGWQRFCPKGKGFKVHFPTEPQFEKRELNLSIARKVVVYDEYVSYDVDQVSYAVSYVRLPLKFRFYGSGTVLKAAFNLIPENGPTAKEVVQKLGVHKKHPALNFSLLNGEHRVQGLLVLIDGMLFKLTVTFPAVLEKDTQSVGFFDSFKTLKQEASVL